MIAAFALALGIKDPVLEGVEKSWTDTRKELDSVTPRFCKERPREIGDYGGDVVPVTDRCAEFYPLLTKATLNPKCPLTPLEIAVDCQLVEPESAKTAVFQHCLPTSVLDDAGAADTTADDDDAATAW